MKQLKLLLCAILLVAFCGCDIFGNDDDDDDNDKTTIFEGSWSNLFLEHDFSGETYSFSDNVYKSNSKTNKKFSYDSTKMNLVLDTDTFYCLLKEKQLLLGGSGDEGGFGARSFQKSGIDSKDNLEMIRSGADPLNVVLPLTSNFFYLDADLDLDTMLNISLISQEFLPYKDTNRAVIVLLSDMKSFADSSLNTEIATSIDFYVKIDLDGYNTDYEKVGKRIDWSIAKFKIASCSYEPTNKFSAVFYDLKDEGGNTILDTLKLDVDCSNIDAFKKMLKGL